jgi:uncharacterized protein
MHSSAKVARLRELLGTLDSVLVAFSGGVDSSYLLHEASAVLGPRCLALTTVSPTTPEGDLDDAVRLARALGVTHVVRETDELAIPGYAENPVNRCFFCKDNLFVICAAEARARGIAAVVDGANVDDLHDHRPGLAAAAEQGVRHPLTALQRTIRGQPPPASRRDRPASCAHVASPVRHADHARRSPASPLPRLPAGRPPRAPRAPSRCCAHRGAGRRHARAPTRRWERVTAEPDGWATVTLDLAGFRSGSMNEVLRSR